MKRPEGSSDDESRGVLRRCNYTDNHTLFWFFALDAAETVIGAADVSIITATADAIILFFTLHINLIHTFIWYYVFLITLLLKAAYRSMGQQANRERISIRYERLPTPLIVCTP